MILTREQALKVSGRSFATLEVPELGGELRLASLSAAPALVANALKERGAKGEDVEREYFLLLLVSAVVDEKGEPLFDRASAEDLLLRVSAETILMIVQAIPAANAPAVPLGNSPASQVAV